MFQKLNDANFYAAVLKAFAFMVFRHHLLMLQFCSVLFHIKYSLFAARKHKANIHGLNAFLFIDWSVRCSPQGGLRQKRLP